VALTFQPSNGVKAGAGAVQAGVNPTWKMKPELNYALLVSGRLNPCAKAIKRRNRPKIRTDLQNSMLAQSSAIACDPLQTGFIRSFESPS
jgi:hypothetical protein